MNETTSKDPVIVDVKFPIPREEFDQLVDFFHYPDVFDTGYIGYWAFGIRIKRPDGTKQYIAYEMVDDREPTDAECQAVVRAFLDHNEVVEPAFLLNERFVREVFAAGITRYGHNFIDNQDATMLDCAIQLAHFGELVYG